MYLTGLPIREKSGSIDLVMGMMDWGQAVGNALLVTEVLPFPCIFGSPSHLALAPSVPVVKALTPNLGCMYAQSFPWSILVEVKGRDQSFMWKNARGKRVMISDDHVGRS